MSTVAVVAAHPDDEILGPGGTLARHVRRGDEVHAIVLSDGATSRYETAMIEVLRSCARGAAEQLGLTTISVGSMPDQRLDMMPIVEVTQHIESALSELRPQIVYTHFAGDVNTDHGVTAHATWIACRPYVLPALRRFAVFETASSTEWAWPLDGGAFRPTLYVDISDTMKEKVAAMACYHSELREYPHPRSLRALEERAAYWGSRVGCTAAEPFQVLREVDR